MRITPALLLLAAALPAAASSHTRRPAAKSTSASIRHASSSASRHSAPAAAVVHHEPVPAMASDRATAIQAALIKSGYLSGEPSGTWDSESVAAMTKFQSDNDWQTKFTPDARALNKLGLGSAPDSAQ